MRYKNLELWIALLIIGLITIGYVLTATTSTIPAASGWIGHSLGIVGFILMFMTEILYSLRKRYQFARWGKLQNWLSFHIITGLVGPYMVLLHTSWKFNGLAGILMLLTIIIVVSGFIGRYFYTSVPRSTEGTALEAEYISKMIQDTEISMAEQNNLRTEIGEKGTGELQERLRHLNRQLKQLDRSRRLLAIWHTFHVPIGIALFFIAFIHIIATLYFATLLH